MTVRMKLGTNFELEAEGSTDFVDWAARQFRAMVLTATRTPLILAKGRGAILIERGDMSLRRRRHAVE